MSYFGSIYADQELSHRAKTVYMYLKDRSNADGTCWPSVRRIAEDLKLSRRTVQRALSDLEHHGFLERTHAVVPMQPDQQPVSHQMNADRAHLPPRERCVLELSRG